MVSISFVYFFLPVFMGIYALIKPKYRSKAAVAASVLFVAICDVKGLIPMAVSVLNGYFGGKMIDKYRDKKGIKRLILITSLVLNSASFFIFAYSNYAPENIVGGYLLNGQKYRPFTAFGVSVYVLHSISYCIDIYKEKYPCERSFMLTAQYITFFPSLTAGPLLRFGRISDTLKNPVITGEKVADGIKFFLMGLAQKLILANTSYEIWNRVRELRTSQISAVTAWIGMIAFAFSFYYEFSGYSLMARGISLMTGFDIPKNMDKPFTSSGFYDFVKRFNITVFQWFYDYIYAPVCEKSESRVRRYSAAFLMTILMSFWYGFGLRTLFFGMFLLLMIFLEYIFSNPLSLIPKPVRNILFNILFLVGLPFLAMVNPADGAVYFLAMFGFNNVNVDMMEGYLLKSSVLNLLLCWLFASGLSGFTAKRVKNINENVLSIAAPVFEIVLLLISTAFLFGEKTELLRFLY